MILYTQVEGTWHQDCPSLIQLPQSVGHSEYPGRPGFVMLFNLNEKVTDLQMTSQSGHQYCVLAPSGLTFNPAQNPSQQLSYLFWTHNQSRYAFSLNWNALTLVHLIPSVTFHPGMRDLLFSTLVPLLYPLFSVANLPNSDQTNNY